MSKFSDQLSQAIKLSGKSKNQIIEESKINRSSFFQFLNGKRMPTKEHLAAILAALQLTPGEEEQLRKLYEIAEIGENIYESRVGCAECLDDLALLTGQNRRPIHEFVGEAVYSVSRAPILGKNRVYQELCHLAQAEMLKPEPKIDLFLPRQPNDFLKYLKSFFQNKSNKKIRMRQIIQFSLNQEEKTKDILSFFNSLLFLMAVSGDSYEAYYYYSDSNLTDTIGALYPYCVMTSSGVMLVTARMDRALFSATDSILVACHAQFQEAISRAKPFIENIGGTEQTTVEHGVWDFWRSGYQYFIAPCFGGYLPDEVLRMYQTPTLAPLMERYVSHMRKEHRYVSFCTREGLLDFARTGILPEYSDQIVPVVAPKARALILKEMLYHPNPSKPIYLLDDSRVQASSEFIFFVAPKERIILQRRQMKGMKVYVFQENNLIHAFSDYFAYLEQSDLILPTRDLNNVLLAGIQIAEALEAEEKKS